MFLVYPGLRFTSSGLPGWSWGGVWDGVKSTVGFLIPYEDFIIIGDQMMYLINQDWQNFDPTALAFASLGAATIIPIAKPLKVVLGPLKKVVDGMKRFPAARHFAGAIGTAVKSALSGKTEKLVDLLPFILIAIELFEDPEVFEFIMNAIESEDDLWVWVEYIAGVVGLEGGLDALAFVDELGDPGVQYAVNPLPGVVGEAWGTPRQDVARIIIRGVKEIADDIADPVLAKKATKALKEIMIALKDPKNGGIKVLLKSGVAIKYFATVGAAKISSFFRNSDKWRVNRWFVLFSIGYLVNEVANGNLQLGGGNRFENLIANVFSGRSNTRNGALFQLSQIAYFHLKKSV